MSIARMRAFIAVATTVIAIVVVGAVVCTAVWYFYLKPRAEQKADFKKDIFVAMGLDITQDPSWDDETTGTGKYADTVSTLELVVKIGNCRVELERDEDEADTTKVNGRDVNHYTVDEIVDKQDNLKGSPKGALTAADIERFLKENYKQYNCV